MIILKVTKNRVLASLCLSLSRKYIFAKTRPGEGQIDPPAFLGLRHFSYLLTRKMSKTKGKNPDKMCKLISLKIYPQQQKQWHKDPLYIYWERQAIYSNSYLKLQNTHEWKSLLMKDFFSKWVRLSF